eukprot:6365208-Prymnesium_polylepis.1
MADDAAAKFTASRAVAVTGTNVVAAPALYGGAVVPNTPNDFKNLGAAAAGGGPAEALACAGAVLACVLSGVWVPAEI